MGSTAAILSVPLTLTTISTAQAVNILKPQGRTLTFVGLPTDYATFMASDDGSHWSPLTPSMSGTSLATVKDFANVYVAIRRDKGTTAAYASVSGEVVTSGWTNSVRMEADSLAADVIAETGFLRISQACTLVGMDYFPDTLVTVSGTNYGILLVKAYSSADASKGNSAFVTSAAGDNWAAGKPKLGTLVTALNFVAGDYLKFTQTKAGTGVVRPAGFMNLNFI
jgi:hypothetical protein